MRWSTVAPLLALGVALLAGLIYVAIGFTDHNPLDAMAYRLAAQRLLHGGELYPLMDPDDRAVYRYAPWFAIAWIPLSLLPLDLSMLLWRAVLLGAAVYTIVAVARIGGPAALVLAALALPLIGAVPSGNVAVLMTALLVWRRADPWSVGLTASLKVYPILMCFGYIGERRWRDLVTAVGLAGLLWAPALWFGLGHYVSSPGRGGALYSLSPLLYLGVASLLLSALLTLAARRSRWTWIATAAAIPYIVPRFFGFDPTYLWAVARRLSDHEKRTQSNSASTLVELPPR